MPGMTIDLFCFKNAMGALLFLSLLRAQRVLDLFVAYSIVPWDFCPAALNRLQDGEMVLNIIASLKAI